MPTRFRVDGTPLQFEALTSESAGSKMVRFGKLRPNVRSAGLYNIMDRSAPNPAHTHLPSKQTLKVKAICRARF